jgi:hypothetical protein
MENKDYDELIELYDKFRELSNDKKSDQKELDDIENKIVEKVRKIFENEPLK